MTARVREHGTEVLVVVATLSLIAFYYLARADAIATGGTGGWFVLAGPARSPTLHFAASAVLLGAVPLAAALWISGVPAAELGLGPGRWREGLLWLAVGLPAAVLAGYIAARSPAMRAVYPLDPTVRADTMVFVPHAARNLLYFGAWEILFRGVLLFGLRSHLGDGSANSAQTALSVVAHFGRPLTETFSALPAGFAFGWISLRVRSIWYVALIHWTVGTSMDWFIVARG